MNGQASTRHKVKSARRDHRCSRCGFFIEAGASYVYWSWRDGTKWEKVKMHPECTEAVDREIEENAERESVGAET